MKRPYRVSLVGKGSEQAVLVMARSPSEAVGDVAMAMTCFNDGHASFEVVLLHSGARILSNYNGRKYNVYFQRVVHSVEKKEG